MIWRIIRQIEQEARVEGDKKAREIIATAIQAGGFRPSQRGNNINCELAGRGDEGQNRRPQRTQHPRF